MSDTVLVTGNTYPVRDKLRALGGVWNAVAKGWDVPAGNAEAARAAVAESVKATATTRQPQHSCCKVCGVLATTHTKIYGSGECRDCYEERKGGH